MTATWKIWNTFSPCNFQNWNDFPSLSTTMIAQLKWKIISLVWIFPEQFITRTVLFFKNPSAKSLLPCSFALKDWNIYNALEASCATALSYFTQGNWFWNWLLKTMGKIDLDFKQSIRLRKSIFPSLLPSRNRFSKALLSSSILNSSGES